MCSAKLDFRFTAFSEARHGCAIGSTAIIVTPVT